MNVQNISQRPGHTDNIYGTGQWDIGEIKDVPDDLAKRLLKHTDVYVKATGKLKDVPKVNIAQPTPDEPLQEIYDSVKNMNRDQMRDFVQTKFNLKLDMRKFPTDDSLREHALMLVNQYGVV